jgi:hypothetical protein
MNPVLVLCKLKASVTIELQEKRLCLSSFKLVGAVFTEILPDCSKATLQAAIRGGYALRLSPTRITSGAKTVLLI